MSGSATFFTVSDKRFFVGTVCLVNSLRLTGHDGQIVVLDAGLTPSQRARLEEAGTVVDRPTGHGQLPIVFKPFPALLEPKGAIVIVDGDVIVTRSLDPLVDRAAAGEILLFSDIEPQRSRWFAEWEELFALAGPPRRQPYLNTGIVVLSADRWPSLLERWWEACELVPPERTLAAGARSADPYCFGDQDALNALLMSEVPADAVVALPDQEAPSADLLTRVRIVDSERLVCRLDGWEPYLLHYWGSPKPWEPKAWLRVRRNAYVSLMPRVLYAPDAPVPVPPRELPHWLRPNLLARIELRVLSALNGLVRRALDRLSYDARNRIARLRRRLIG